MAHSVYIPVCVNIQKFKIVACAQSSNVLFSKQEEVFIFSGILFNNIFSLPKNQVSLVNLDNEFLKKNSVQLQIGVALFVL